MKQISRKTKILSVILVLIVIAGVIVAAVKGFNVEKRYRANQQMTIYIGEEIELEKVKTILNETFGKNIATVQYVDIYKDIIQINAKQITGEQKKTVVEKINNIYSNNVQNDEDNTENQTEVVNIDEVQVITISNIRIRDFMKPYVISLIIVTILLLIYVGIRFYKIGIFNSILKTGGILLICQAVLISLMAIVRLPIGRLTPAMILVVYMLSVIYITRKLENNIK